MLTFTNPLPRLHAAALAARLDERLAPHGWGLFFDSDTQRPWWPWLGRQGRALVFQLGRWELVKDIAPAWWPGAAR